MNAIAQWAKDLESRVIRDMLRSISPIAKEYAMSTLGSQQAAEYDHSNVLVVVYWEQFRRNLGYLCLIEMARARVAKLAERNSQKKEDPLGREDRISQQSSSAGGVVLR